MLDRLIGNGWGSLDLDFVNRAYHLGDDVEGSVTVHAKRGLGPGRLFVALTCDERESRTVPTAGRAKGRGGRTGSGARVTVHRESSNNRLWKCEVDLAIEEWFEPGSETIHPFTVKVPEASEPSPEPELPGWARGTVAVIDAMTFRSHSVVWKLNARFTHDGGFDLRRSATISVNP